MLQEIKNLIYKTFSAQDVLGLFFSAFDSTWKLLISNGVLETNKNLETLLDLFYNGMLKPYESQIWGIVFDIVGTITPQQDINAFLQLSPKEYWVVLTSMQNWKSGVLLPDTQWIQNMQQVIACIKQKYQLQGNAEISVFKTTKILYQK